MSSLLMAWMVVWSVVLAAVLFWILSERRRAQSASSAQSSEWMVQFQKEIQEVRNVFQKELTDLHHQMKDQHAQNTQFLLQSHRGYSESVEKVQHRLGELQTATQSMVDIGKDIASLQDILRAPKLRGGLGELLLDNLLSQILPGENYTLQHLFKDGSRADAMIQLGEGMIPVDAKFPMESFQRLIQEASEESLKEARKEFVRSVKKLIDETSKYIRPNEGTYDFALMYVPAENIYYEILTQEDQGGENLSEYARSKNVVPVSPNSFFAYLQLIARGLKGLRIERSALKIFQALQQLESDLVRILDDFRKTGAHLSNAQSAYDRAMKNFEKFQDRVSLLSVSEEKTLLTANEPPKL